ncbi:hypothetical protein ABZ070_28395 [Streptomyces sp. NPDC006283]|uniref:hypothetical protein n=1 Tax=Streptomyces sp. NPDC006283 TaxID=3156741 RepID=UPI0033BD3C26
MSETTGTAKVHEAYSFACMRCGHGWEQSYEIEHHVDTSGQEFIVYKTDGRRVPSPLSSPTCLNCGGHVVRIMRAGRVSSVQNMMAYLEGETTPSGATVGAGEAVPGERQPARETAGAEATAAAADAPASEDAQGESRHWHLSDLLHPFQHRK